MKNGREAPISYVAGIASYGSSTCDRSQAPPPFEWLDADTLVWKDGTTLMSTLRAPAMTCDPTTAGSASKKATVACALGNALEMYDFTIYSFLLW